MQMEIPGLKENKAAVAQANAWLNESQVVHVAMQMRGQGVVDEKGRRKINLGHQVYWMEENFILTESRPATATAA